MPDRTHQTRMTSGSPAVKAQARRRVHRRDGQILVKLVIGLVACGVIGFLFFRQSGADGEPQHGRSMLLATVERGEFVSIVTETGDIESASNDEVRCGVKSAGGDGTTILKIVDEGTIVKKGEFLIQFDGGALELELTAQEILVATDEAGVIQAQSELDKAKHALREYENGTFQVEKETIEAELLEAESTLKSLQDSLVHTRRMTRKGYTSRVQLEAQETAVRMAEKAVQVSKMKLQALEEFTLEKMMTEMRAEVQKQTALLKAATQTLQLSQQRRDDLAEQVTKCRVLAPGDGQVVYANDPRREIVIEEGIQVREGQVVIRLPDPDQMQVDTKINDSKINKVAVGCEARIILDVDPDLEIHGELTKLEPYPYPRRWHGAPIEYGAIVTVKDPPRSLRPGQRAKVLIYAERRDDVLTAPLQSVVARGGRHYCLIRDGQADWQVRGVTVGPDNDQFVVIEGGLKEGEQIALNPDLIWDDVAAGLPHSDDPAVLTSARSR